MDLGLSQGELKEFTQKAVQLILSGREGEDPVMEQYKASAQFRAGVQLACAAMVLVMAENNGRIAEQLRNAGVIQDT